MAEGIPAGLTTAEGRKFGITVGAVFLLLGGVSIWRGKAILAIVLCFIGGILIGGGVLFPSRLGPVHRAWMALALAISKVMNPIVLGIVYFLILTPVGVLRRLLGQNPLIKKESQGGYWITRSSEGIGSRNMEKQF